MQPPPRLIPRFNPAILNHHSPSVPPYPIARPVSTRHSYTTYNGSSNDVRSGCPCTATTQNSDPYSRMHNRSTSLGGRDAVDTSTTWCPGVKVQSYCSCRRCLVQIVDVLRGVGVLVRLPRRAARGQLSERGGRRKYLAAVVLEWTAR